MCGLICVFSKKNKRAGQYAFDLYKKQENRGKRGYGYLAIENGVIVNIERARDENQIKPLLLKETASTILLHHRFPTSTDNSVGTTHPMFVSHEELEYDYYVGHNGVIVNSVSMKSDHEKLGYQYLTEHKVYEVAEFIHGDDRAERLSTPVTKFNDSESLAIEFARYIEGKKDKIGANGAAALWAVAVEKGTDNVVSIYYGRNHGRELCHFQNKKWFVVSSETGTAIDPMKLFTIDLKDFSQTVSDFNTDDAKPVTQTMGYRTSNYYPRPSTQPQLPTPAGKATLYNRKYSLAEVEKSGHPRTAFTSVWENTGVFYIPTEFIDQPRGELNWESIEKKVEDDIRDLDREKKKYPQKQVARLEELAMEYATAKYKCEYADDLLASGALQYQEYSSVYGRHDADASMAFDLMATLGLPDDLIEEVIDTSIDLVDFNNSFSPRDLTYLY